MITAIIITLTLLSLSLIGASVYLSRATAQQNSSEDEIDDSPDFFSETAILEHQIRSSMRSTELEINNCDRQLQQYSEDIKAILHPVGKRSEMYIKNKALFFDFKDELIQQHFFYYQRDLDPSIDQELQEKSRLLAQEYKEELALWIQKKTLFIQLLNQHKEQLQDLQGIQRQDLQLSSILRYQQQLTKRSDEQQKSDSEQIYRQLILEDLQHEVQRQEEIVKAYIDIKNEHELPQKEVQKALDRLQQQVNKLDQD